MWARVHVFFFPLCWSAGPYRSGGGFYGGRHIVASGNQWLSSPSNTGFPSALLFELKREEDNM